MHNFKTSIVYCLFLIFLVPSIATGQYRDLKEAEKLYDQEDYSASAQKYNKILATTDNQYADYNAANALSKLGNHAQAIQRYQKVVNNSQDKDLLAQAYYNIGNNQLSLNNLQEASEAFKNALRINPTDEDARHNYLYTQQLMRMMENQEQNPQDNQQQEKQENEQDDSESQASPMDSLSDEMNEEAQEMDTIEEDSHESQQKGSEKLSTKDELSNLEAERLLEIIQQRDEEIQKKLIQKKGGKSPSTKKW